MIAQQQQVVPVQASNNQRGTYRNLYSLNACVVVVQRCLNVYLSRNKDYTNRLQHQGDLLFFSPLINTRIFTLRFHVYVFLCFLLHFFCFFCFFWFIFNSFFFFFTFLFVRIFCICACICAHVYVCYVCVCVCARACVSVYVCMYVCNTYACPYFRSVYAFFLFRFWFPFLLCSFLLPLYVFPHPFLLLFYEYIRLYLCRKVELTIIIPLISSHTISSFIF